jgi:hypothetical protein
MSQRLYKFMSTQYGLDNLAKRRLKISTIDDLNDPFDLAAVDTTDPQIEQLLELHIKGLRGRRGILCFSRNWDNILLWSHYGGSHTGICLGFDAPDEYGLDVHYQPNLLQIHGPEGVNEELVMRMLRTKHESWSYEQEVRLFIGINDPPDANGLWWADFGTELELKEVIAGAQCSPKDLNTLGGILETFEPAIKRSWAYMRKDAFLLVRHDFPPPWF